MIAVGQCSSDVNNADPSKGPTWSSTGTRNKVIEGVVHIPGTTLRIGSDQHCPEEAPAHRVTVDGFWMDATTVTNRQF